MANLQVRTIEFSTYTFYRNHLRNGELRVKKRCGLWFVPNRASMYNRALPG